MTAPVRLQLSRRKGFDLQSLSRASNCLPAVVVARPSKWGNSHRFLNSLGHETDLRRARAVELFRADAIEMDLAELRGKNLACWCALDAPCHADVLLELANRPEPLKFGLAGEER